MSGLIGLSVAYGLGSQIPWVRANWAWELPFIAFGLFWLMSGRRRRLRITNLILLLTVIGAGLAVFDFGLAGWLAPAEPEAGKRETYTGKTVGRILHRAPHPQLGYWFEEEGRFGSSLENKDRVFYNSLVTIKDRHRASGRFPGPRPLAATFFGGSFTFGRGMNDTETIPAVFGQAARAYEPYNFANSGWGPAQFLWLLEQGWIRGKVRQMDGIGIYVFIPDHIRRMAGRKRNVYPFPCYLPDARDELVYSGSLIDNYPFRFKIIEGFGRELSRKRLSFRLINEQLLPFQRISRADGELTGLAVNKAARLFKEQFNGPFYLALYFNPDSLSGEEATGVGAMLSKIDRDLVGVVGLDSAFSGFEPTELALVPGYDNHPSRLANRLAGEYLARFVEADRPNRR